MSQNVVRPRDTQDRGLGANAPLHLRRICGTCKHFEGTMRQVAPAGCALHGGLGSARASAAECEDWARRWGHS